MLVALLLCALSASAPGAAAPAPSPQEAQEPVSDQALRTAIERLSKQDRAEAAEWFRFECSNVDSESHRSIASALALLGEDPGFLELESPAPFYDPKVHTRGQGARRHVLDARSSRVGRQRRAFGLVPPAGALVTAYRYDWATGTIRRRAEGLSPEELFQNALAGYLPDYDLARAILLSKLDDGSQRAALAAFGHAYADRAGNVFPGITLFDAWASGKTIEMPDVDTLGLIHDLMQDWKRWTAPVPPAQHGALYSTLGEFFVPARRLRSFRESVADFFLCADPVPPGIYLPAADAIGAAWVEAEYDPDRMAKRLPSGDASSDWIRTQRESLRDDPAPRIDFDSRRALLRSERRIPRVLLVRVLRGMDALKPEKK